MNPRNLLTPPDPCADLYRRFNELCDLIDQRAGRRLSHDERKRYLAYLLISGYGEALDDAIQAQLKDIPDS